MRQNRQNGGRLPQGLEAEHPAEDSPPYQDANASAPTNHCDGAGCRSNGQENRSQYDIDYVAAERCQSCICGSYAIHLKAPFRWRGLSCLGMKLAMDRDKEYGNDRSAHDTILFFDQSVGAEL
jgi:hypothetical protein